MFLKRKKTLFAIIILVAVGISTFAFRHLAQWLVISDPLPLSIDAIFTFAGETNRLVYSKELYGKYKGAEWLISYPSKKIAIPLRKDGFDTSRIQIVDSCKNTNSEVLFITSWAVDKINKSNKFTRQNPLQVGLVSTPFHMRRIRMQIMRKSKNDLVRYYFLPVPYNKCGFTKEDYKMWWKNYVLKSAIILELKKVVYYFFKY